MIGYITCKSMLSICDSFLVPEDQRICLLACHGQAWVLGLVVRVPRYQAPWGGLGIGHEYSTGGTLG